MEFHKAAQAGCPINIIALAINGDNSCPHCGIVYTRPSGQVCLCHLLFEQALKVDTLPDDFYWTTVRLEDYDVVQIMMFVEFLLQRHQNPIRYSFIYPAEGFDKAGTLLGGATCATFVSRIFDSFKFNVVDLTAWRIRPIQDARFRKQIIAFAQRHGYAAAAARLRVEPQHYRLKPWELFGSATHSRYPIKFVQAKKLAKIVTKLMHRYNAHP